MTAWTRSRRSSFIRTRFTWVRIVDSSLIFGRYRRLRKVHGLVAVLAGLCSSAGVAALAMLAINQAHSPF